MCGIAGIISDAAVGEGDRRIVSAMLDRLDHRGPDGRGLWVGKQAVLGHTRLAVIDPKTGRQPIGNEDGTIWIVVNGEIYNYRDLRTELESKGHRFKTHSDSETILHLYEQVGPSCTERLRGMFALAIWDSRRHQLLLARDPIGVKPLYYARCSDQFIFASELTALLAHPDVPRRIDVEAVQNFLTFHYVPSPQTILSGISKLCPAERLTVTDGRVRTQTYWDLSFRCNEGINSEQWQTTIRDHIDDAVRAHMVSDVPVGAFLSGGLDSGTVVATMANACGDRITTFTAGFNDARWDERDEARQLAATLDTDHFEELVQPHAENIVETIADTFDEPFADPSAIPTYYISRLARRRVKVVLSGDGGDELLGGYTRYRRHAVDGAMRRCLRPSAVRSIARSGSALLGGRIRSLVRNLSADDDYAHFLNVAWFAPEETHALFNGDAVQALGNRDPFDVLAAHFSRCDTDDPLARWQYVDLKSWLADGVLCKVDRAAMAHGLEVRVPMLDTRWAALAAGIPSRFKIHKGRGKHILREAMRPVLGDAVVNRTKRGFEVPLDIWFTGPLQTLMTDLLLTGEPRLVEWLDPVAIQRAWRQLQSGRRGMGTRLWALLMLELWIRRNLQPPSHTRLEATLVGQPAEIVA